VAIFRLIEVDKVFFLFKPLCYSFVYVLPRYILRKDVHFKRLIMFLIVSCITLPILRDSLDSTSLKDGINSYGDLVLSFLLVV